MSKVSKRPVVFLDRDGTLNKEIGYIRNVDDLVLIEGAAEAVKRLNASGVAVVLVTNQTGAARGYYPESHIRELNNRLCRLLSQQDATLDAIYYCPHLADAPVAAFNVDCSCRKPKTAMVDRAFAEHADYDQKRAYVVGDKATDVELAHNCRAKGILVETGYGQEVIGGRYQWPVKPDCQAPDIAAAVDWILSDLGLRQTVG